MLVIADVEKYLKLADRSPEGLDPHTKVVSEKILGRDAEVESRTKQDLDAKDIVKNLTESGNVGEARLLAITEGLGVYNSFHEVATRAGSLERDFTTRGTRGSLRCPFSKSPNLSSENGVNGIETPLPAQNGDTCAYQHLDPIKEEQEERRSSLAPSARSSSTRCRASRCPIRFLDQHRPEEIADYVERHKHEIPRSHAVCVKRYSNSSRQMDAKYGGLTNMIRGLSEKHQAFLPGRGSQAATSSSAERVEKWAEDVKPQTPGEAAADNDEERKGHFDRPLRDIRVGESPSRPWGIHVPAPSPAPEPTTQSPPAPALAVDKPSDDVAADAPMPAPKGRCPFGHGAGAPPPDPRPIDTETIRKEEPVETPDATNMKEERPNEDLPKSSSANVVFNGPVFFGYSAEQTAAFMQQLGSVGINNF